MADVTYVEAADLFTTVAEGDQILFDGRDEPLTVHRHVTEDDDAGQVITMKTVTEDMAAQTAWEYENGHCANPNVRAGDLLTMSLTGDEFLIARGPRGGCYLLTQWWSKHGGEWSAATALYRRTRADNEVWTWENTVTISVVGHEAVDRAAFDAGGDWTRHTEVQDSDVTVWEDAQAGDAWDHSEALTGTAPREPEPTTEPWETLEAVSEGDTIRVNGRTATVTDVTDETDGVLADGVRLALETADGELAARTFSAKGHAGLLGPDIDGGEDVTDVELEAED